MITVRIEHPIKSYDAWKRAFDAAPVDRRGSGVRRYQVLRVCPDRSERVIWRTLRHLSWADA